MASDQDGADQFTRLEVWRAPAPGHFRCLVLLADTSWDASPGLFRSAKPLTAALHLAARLAAAPPPADPAALRAAVARAVAVLDAGIPATAPAPAAAADAESLDLFTFLDGWDALLWTQITGDRATTALGPGDASFRVQGQPWHEAAYAAHLASIAATLTTYQDRLPGWFAQFPATHPAARAWAQVAVTQDLTRMGVVSFASTALRLLGDPGLAWLLAAHDPVWPMGAPDALGGWGGDPLAVFVVIPTSATPPTPWSLPPATRSGPDRSGRPPRRRAAHLLPPGRVGQPPRVTRLRPRPRRRPQPGPPLRPGGPVPEADHGRLRGGRAAAPSWTTASRGSTWAATAWRPPSASPSGSAPAVSGPRRSATAPRSRAAPPACRSGALRTCCACPPAPPSACRAAPTATCPWPT